MCFEFIADIRFYGMLKTLGTTARQQKITKAIKLSLMGIPIDYCWDVADGRLLPAIVNAVR